MRVLQLGSDRSKQGILFPDTPAAKRQEAYAKAFGELYIIGFSRRGDGARPYARESLHVTPTASGSRLWYAFDALRIAKRLPQPEAISVQDPFETGLIGYFIAAQMDIPLHVQIHTDFLSPAYRSHSLLNRIRVYIARFVLRRADGVRVVSSRIADSLNDAGWKLKAPPIVLPIFADTARFKATTPDPALAERFSRFSYRVLIVSRLEAEKDVELAVSSFAKSSPKDACLIVVGEGSLRKKLQRYAAERGVLARVFFEGAQDPAPYYALADLVLVASRYEGYGLVIVEALAAGKPVLSTDVGVAREVGAIVAPREEYAAALKGWFANGPRTGALKGYPYTSFDAYVSAYADDIAACVTKQKKQ